MQIYHLSIKDWKKTDPQKVHQFIVGQNLQKMCLDQLKKRKKKLLGKIGFPQKVQGWEHRGVSKNFNTRSLVIKELKFDKT